MRLLSLDELDLQQEAQQVSAYIPYLIPRGSPGKTGAFAWYHPSLGGKA